MSEENKNTNIKANPEETKRLREIVLESIGEKKEEKQEKSVVDEKISNFLVKNAGKKSAPEVFSIAKKLKKETRNKVLESLGEKKVERQKMQKPKKINQARLPVRQTGLLVPQASAVINENKNKERSKILIAEAIKFSLAFIILCFISLNLLFSFIVYTFQPKNRIFIELSKYFITPVVLSNVGWIEYYDYQNYLLKNYGVNANLASEQVQIDLIERMAIKKIAKEYGIKIYSISNINDEAFARINKAVLLSSLNKGPLEKITKARELIMAGDNFQEVVKKYSDEYSYGFITKEGALEKFGPAVKHLDIGEISNIILTADGYYLIQMTEKREGAYGLKHIFIKANKTLEDLVKEETKSIKLWSLVD